MSQSLVRAGLAQKFDAVVEPASVPDRMFSGPTNGVAMWSCRSADLRGHCSKHMAVARANRCYPAWRLHSRYAGTHSRIVACGHMFVVLIARPDRPWTGWKTGLSKHHAFSLLPTSSRAGKIKTKPSGYSCAHHG